MFIKQLSVFIENKEGRLDEVLNNLSVHLPILQITVC